MAELIGSSRTVDAGAAGDDGRAWPAARGKSLARRRWVRYILALALVGVVTLLGLLIDRVVAPANLVMLYLAVVVVCAMYLGRGPSVLAALLSVLVFDFFLVPPRLTLAVSDTQYLLTFAGLLIVGLVISSLTSLARDQAASAKSREVQAVALYDFSRDLSVAREPAAVLDTVIRHVGQTFSREAVILLPDEAGELSTVAASLNPNIDKAEMAVAVWAYHHNQPAGRGTDYLPDTRVRYLPLRTPRGVVGVLGVAPADLTTQLSPDQRRLMDTFASHAALAIERAQLAEHARRAQMLETTEKLQTALLNSISHDLRTPLVTITGAFTSLETAAGHLDEATRTSLARAGREEAERLNQLVGNLLDMTRIQAGALQLTEEPADLGEAIGVVLDRLSSKLEDHAVDLELPPDLPAVPMDMPLIVQAVFNIVDNAVKYSPPGSPIAIKARQAGDGVQVEVSDQGPGIPAEDLPHIFEKFYRVKRRDGIGGIGLGFSISKGIIEAHGGTIAVTNQAAGGTAVTIVLPASVAERSGGTDV